MIKLRHWYEDLIWCPSQCYYYIKSEKGNYYCIYLRWRYSDPWTAEIIILDKNNLDDICDNTEWFPLQVNDYKDSELAKLEREAVRLANDWIKEHEKE